ncbi:MAG: glycosyltransferase family 4 protein [Chloroflexi bacterium]|nr:glycosyltransferase family 4 protein [Chloroflexota bacterium]
MATIPYRLGLQQRVFPAYRAAFFDALAAACVGGLSVFSGEPMSGEALGKEGHLNIAQHVRGQNGYIGWGPLLTVWQQGLIDWLERWRPDVLIVEANPRNASVNRAVRWMRRRGGCPVIGWGLGAPPVIRSIIPDSARRSGGRQRLLDYLNRFLTLSRSRFLAQFDALIAYSRTGANEYIAAGVPAERVFVAPNAVTMRPTQPPPERPPDFGDDGPVVLFVGRLQQRKRVDALLRACAALGEQGPRLVIVGDGPARAGFEALAREIYPRAVFAGPRHGPELAPFFDSADLFVLPGTGGLAVQQAMSAGLPVMVAEADGTQADLVRPENGWLLPPNDDEALTRALAEALSDPARLRRMGRESYNIVVNEVNVERMVEVFGEAVAYACAACR